MLVRYGFTTPGKKRKTPETTRAEDDELDLDMDVSQEELDALDSDLVSSQAEDGEVLDDIELIEQASKLQEAGCQQAESG